MHEELGNDPQIKYLYETPAIPGRDPAEEDKDDERLSDPENPLVAEIQKFWDMRAVMNFGLGGMSSGLGFVVMLAWFADYLNASAMHEILIGSAILMAIGLFSVFLEIGRKMRSLQAIKRPQSSWMTREIYVVAIYYPAIAAWLIWPQSWLLVLAGFSGLAFLYSQARILQAGKGIPGWRVPMMIWMLVATGLYEGAGLYALIFAFMSEQISFGTGIAVFALVLAIVNAMLWHLYRKNAKENGIPPLARKVINKISPVLHIIGHFLPAILLAGVMIWPAMPDWGIGLLGLLIVFGGFFWKAMIITRASYQQGFALSRYPQRGSGHFAAPTRLEGYSSKMS
jgi:phenylacetyl-CoA:acceptor oxidoreductase subunit 2